MLYYIKSLKNKDRYNYQKNQNFLFKLQILAYMKKYIAELDNQTIISTDDSFREFCKKGCFGKPEKIVKISILEALYLVDKEKLTVLEKNKEKSREISFLSLLRKLSGKRLRPRKGDFWVRYLVYKDLRDRGYIVKTALKFGAEFRVYDRGIKPGEDHAKWIVYPCDESNTLTWYEFSAKNRVAHSTRKRLMLAIVDAENDVTYYEVRWVRP